VALAQIEMKVKEEEEKRTTSFAALFLCITCCSKSFRRESIPSSLTPRVSELVPVRFGPIGTLAVVASNVIVVVNDVVKKICYTTVYRRDAASSIKATADRASGEGRNWKF